jgi:hypothetical protein
VPNTIHTIPLLVYGIEGQQQEMYFTLKGNIPITVTIGVVIIWILAYLPLRIFCKVEPKGKNRADTQNITEVFIKAN